MIGHLINNSSSFLKERLALKYQCTIDTFAKYEIFFEFRDIKNQKSELFNSKDVDIFYTEKESSLLISAYSIDTLTAKAEFFENNFREILLKVVSNYRSNYEFRLDPNKFSDQKFLIMGILNVTTDSFSDGGKFLDSPKAVEHALNLMEKGADIIDVGGESSRPGADPVSVKTELKRVIPVIEGIKLRNKNAVISVDTTKSVVAREAVEAGAEIINDISAGNFDSEIFHCAAEKKVPLILMHMKGNPKTMQNKPHYDDVISEIYDFLHKRIAMAKNAGVINLVVDPGVGFGKRTQDNYEIINRLDEFKGLGFSSLVGLSRKSFLGKSLHLDIDKRDNATLSAEISAAYKGVSILRTHNVKKLAEARKIISFIENPEAAANV